MARPENPDIGGGRYAILAQLFIKHPDAHLVLGFDPRGDAGALGKDDQLTGLGRAMRHIGDHLFDCLAAFAAIDRDAADFERILPNHRRPHQLAFHDEFARRDGAEYQQNIKEALVFCGNHHRVCGRRAAYFSAQPDHPGRRPANPAAIGFARQ